ncbi:VOC family protein [Paenibacillus dokdonensis]|uniref:VOC family protein n=1 Tax=Paenibacillus dokdonensis TaxID=2567944 RepID=A0ABU6GGE6_9BACL|nr:VOC family protein [Paenibacillus dokdonensis]MEC0238543.1 VOC family protein [Paenibacillus dokdonensis]
MTHSFSFLRIGYVYMPTTRIDKSIAWYTEHLDFKLMDKFEDRGSLLAVLHHPHLNSIAMLLIETHDKQQLEITRNSKPFPVMALNCADIKYTYDKLKNAGVAVEELHTLGEGEAKYFYFRDPEGNLLEAAWSKWDPQDEIKDHFK